MYYAFLSTFYKVPRHTVAAVPRWEPETGPFKPPGGRRFERAVLSFRNAKQVLGSFATLNYLGLGYLISS
jgi:hypothetical protein